MTAALATYSLSETVTGYSLDPVAAGLGGGALPGSGSNYAIIDLPAGPLFAAYAAATGDLDLYDIQTEAPVIAHRARIAVGAGWDQLYCLTFAGKPHVMLYQKKTGQFSFSALGKGLKLSAPYLFNRTHKPAVSKNFTMVRPFVLANGIVIMGYAFDSGAVAMYSLTGVVSPSGNAPPVVANPVWEHEWASGWTRFAFFYLGAEVFFLKTNTKYPNVNIDHVLDAPTSGTVEVATNMDLADGQALSIVEPFELNDGHPHFVAYRPDGLTTIYRIHPNCAGWTKLVSANLPPRATAILSVPNGGRSQTIFCVSGT